MNPSQESARSPEPAQPSGPPSAQPSGRPLAQPSGPPVARPSGPPPAHLSGPPSGQPSGPPPAHLSGPPSGQPSGPPPADPTADPGAYGAPLGGASTTGGSAATGGGGSFEAGDGSSVVAAGSSADGSPAGEIPASGTSDAYGLPTAGGGYELAHPTGPEASFASKWWGLGSAPRRPWKRTALVAVLSAVVIFALGGPLGLLWAWIAPSVPVVATGQNIVVNDPSPEEYIAADGWYTLLGLGFGILVAVIAWLVLRRDRGPFLLLGVIVGTLGAGYLLAPWVGEMIGKSAYEQWRETAVRGATYLAPPEVHSTGPMLVPAFAAAIVLTLLAGWSNDPDLDEPGAKPGYGPNAAAHHGPPPPWPGVPETESPDHALSVPVHPEAGHALNGPELPGAGHALSGPELPGAGHALSGPEHPDAGHAPGGSEHSEATPEPPRT
ncbi:hypothetical protein ACQPZX_10025 [Actinoplanes sp. CA-142083]|uniref:hypothetical protein n=1 Tax=Actinoplanes sp. CA-142083 TaxID=3239903 RepID=UPI003D919FC2